MKRCGDLDPLPVCTDTVPSGALKETRQSPLHNGPTDYATNSDLEGDETASGCTKCEWNKLLHFIGFPIVALFVLIYIHSLGYQAKPS